MKIKDVITEAKMDPGIRKEMLKKGYKFLGKGQDQDVYLAPDGTILKIFGTDYDSNGAKYSKGQRSVIDFIKFCQANPNNPFLPTFGGFERFEYNGKHYLQIKCERLFDFDKQNAEAIAVMLEMLIVRIKMDGVKGGDAFLNRAPQFVGGGNKWYRNMITRQNDAKAQLILLLGGKEPTMQLLDTVVQLQKIAKRKGYGLDLHSGNFMLGSDGHIVISDPFFTGTFR